MTCAAFLAPTRGGSRPSSVEMCLCGFGEGVNDPQSDARMHRKVRDSSGRDPRGLTGLVTVGRRPAGDRGREKADRELLTSLSGVGVEHDMTRIGVNTGQTRHLHRHTALFRHLTDRSDLSGFAQFNRPPGNSQLPESARRTSRTSPERFRATTKAVGLIEFAAGDSASW